MLSDLRVFCGDKKYINLFNEHIAFLKIDKTKIYILPLDYKIKKYTYNKIQRISNNFELIYPAIYKKLEKIFDNFNYLKFENLDDKNLMLPDIKPTKQICNTCPIVHEKALMFTTKKNFYNIVPHKESGPSKRILFFMNCDKYKILDYILNTKKIRKNINCFCVVDDKEFNNQHILMEKMCLINGDKLDYKISSDNKLCSIDCSDNNLIVHDFDKNHLVDAIIYKKAKVYRLRNINDIKYFINIVRKKYNKRNYVLKYIDTTIEDLVKIIIKDSLVFDIVAVDGHDILAKSLIRQLVSKNKEIIHEDLLLKYM